jgi:GLPGLI family protein
MKKLLIAGLTLFIVGHVSAQQKEGKIIYQRTTQFQISFSGPGGPETAAPRTRTDKFELNFANNQMSWKQMEDEIEDEGFSGSGSVMIRTFGGGDEMTFCDFNESKKLEQRELFDKKFLVTDSIRKGNWKLTDETKTILDHVCRKATSQRIGKRMSMSMENSKMERKEIDDTSTLVAWFTTDIPVSAGPEVQGQLPGMILALESNNGKTVYTAIEISAKPDLKAIKEPTKGKKVSPAQFTIERNTMMDEMQKNNQGRRGIQMRVN